MTEPTLPMSLRTLSGELQYQKAKQNGTLLALSEEPSIQNWIYWHKIANRFPYSMIFSRHDMLIPNRQVAEMSDLSPDEFSELQDILAHQINDYDLWFVNTHKRRSIFEHLHIHIAKYVNNREDIKP